MRSAPLILSFALAACTTSPAAAPARGEQSFRLPEVRASVAPAPEVVRKPVWRAAADPSAWDDDVADVIAHGAGVVAFATGGRICGFAESDGRRVWCASRGRWPVFAGGEFAYVAFEGGVRAVGAATGAPRWRVPGGTHVWAAGDDFIFLGGERLHNQSWKYGEISPSGRVRWATGIDVGTVRRPVVFPPFVLQTVIESGATLHGAQFIMRLGARGGRIGELGGAWSVVGVRGNEEVFNLDVIEEIEDHFLTFDIGIADLRTGATTARFRYEPDYDANLALYNANKIHMAENNPGMGIEGDSLYLTVGSSVYRYRLADGRGQRPLLMSTDGMIGGPSHGTIYVARKDGVWALRPRAHDTQARLVAPSSSAVTMMRIAGGTAYFSFENGRLRGVNVDDGRTVLDALACRANRIGASASRVYVVCGSEPRPNLPEPPWRVFAFPR